MKDIKTLSRSSRYNSGSERTAPTISLLPRDKLRVRDIRHKVERFESMSEYDDDSAEDDLYDKDTPEYTYNNENGDVPVSRGDDFYDRYRKPSNERVIKKRISGGSIRRLLLLVTVAGIIYFCYTYVFNSATVVITPRIVEKVVKGNYVVDKYETVKIERSIERELPRSEKKKVVSKATGMITIYNNYSSDTQKLIKNTRFESSEGKIFRITDSVVVPGKVGEVMGKVEARVSADSVGESYNIKAGRFTIPGLKNSPRYAGFYAESISSMTGGADSYRQIVGKDDVANALNEMTIELKEKIKQDFSLVKKDGYIPLIESIKYDITDNLSAYESGSEPVFRVKATAEMTLANQQSLYTAIMRSTDPYFKGDMLSVSNLNSLKIRLSSDVIPLTLSTSTAIEASTTIKSVYVEGVPSFVYLTDLEALRQELAGKSNVKADLEAYSYSKFPSISTASGEVAPFWTNNYPTNPSKIEIIVK